MLKQLAVAVLAVVVGMGVGSNNARAQDLDQPPDRSFWTSSSPHDSHVVAENFLVLTEFSLHRFAVWGIYSDGDPATDEFHLLIHESAGNLPGDLIYQAQLTLVGD